MQTSAERNEEFVNPCNLPERAEKYETVVAENESEFVERRNAERGNECSTREYRLNTERARDEFEREYGEMSDA